MKDDSIVDQIHRVREEIAERFDNDLHSICEDARRRQEQSGRKSVKLPARPADQKTESSKTKQAG